jgi:hypothetical protein
MAYIASELPTTGTIHMNEQISNLNLIIAIVGIVGAVLTIILLNVLKS